MPLSYKEVTSNGQSNQDISFDFDYLEESHISVYVDGTLKTYQTHWNLPDANRIEFASGQHPASGAVIRIERNTPSTTRIVDFQDGSVLSEKDLDDSARQIFFISQEASDTANDAVIVDTDGKIDGQNRNIKNVAAPTANDHAVNLGYMSSNISAIQTVENDITNVNTVATNIADVNTLADTDNLADINTIADYVSNVNTFSNYYKIGATEPTGNSDGRLWWDTTNNTLKLYNGDTSAFQAYNTSVTTEFNGLKVDTDGNLQWVHGTGTADVEDYKQWFFGLSDLVLSIDSSGHLIAEY